MSIIRGLGFSLRVTLLGGAILGMLVLAGIAAKQALGPGSSPEAQIEKARRPQPTAKQRFAVPGAPVWTPEPRESGAEAAPAN